MIQTTVNSSLIFEVVRDTGLARNVQTIILTGIRNKQHHRKELFNSSEMIVEVQRLRKVDLM